MSVYHAMTLAEGWFLMEGLIRTFCELTNKAVDNFKQLIGINGELLFEQFDLLHKILWDIVHGSCR